MLRPYGEEFATQSMGMSISHGLRPWRAERWRSIRVTECQRRQMQAVREGLDRFYEAEAGLAKPPPKEKPQTEIPSTSPT